MDSTVQTVQEVGSQVSQYKQMFENYLPDITKFGIKVVLAIVAFWVGSTVIKWIVKVVKKSLTKSVLDDIPGIGEKRKKNLLSHFKNIESIKAATFEQLLEVESINKTAAENIYNYFKSEE